MFGFSLKLDLKRTLAIFAALSLLCTGVVVMPGAGRRGVSAATEQERMEYICSLGYMPSLAGAETTEISIPEEFSDVYENYNTLQKQAGFDLSNYKGCLVTRYTYCLADFPADEYVVANILVKDEKIIGGDISSRRLDGFMLPLEAKKNG